MCAVRSSTSPFRLFVQVLTGPDPELSDMVRATVRLARQNYERQCLQRKVKPWWRDPAWMSWMISSDTSHKCMQGFGCGRKAPKIGSNKALWWDEMLLPLTLTQGVAASASVAPNPMSR